VDLVCIQKSDKEEGLEQQYVEGHATTQKDAKEGEIPKA
jgi:hypothetical protein